MVILRGQGHSCFHTEHLEVSGADPWGSVWSHSLEARELQVRDSRPEATLGEGIWKGKHSDLLLHLQAPVAPGHPVGSQKPDSKDGCFCRKYRSAPGAESRVDKDGVWTGRMVWLTLCGGGHPSGCLCSICVTFCGAFVAGRERGPNGTVSKYPSRCAGPSLQQRPGESCSAL